MKTLRNSMTFQKFELLHLFSLRNNEVYSIFPLNHLSLDLCLFFFFFYLVYQPYLIINFVLTWSIVMHWWILGVSLIFPLKAMFVRFFLWKTKNSFFLLWSQAHIQSSRKLILFKCILRLRSLYWTYYRRSDKF